MGLPCVIGTVQQFYRGKHDESFSSPHSLHSNPSFPDDRLQGRSTGAAATIRVDRSVDTGRHRRHESMVEAEVYRCFIAADVLFAAEAMGFSTDSGPIEQDPK